MFTLQLSANFLFMEVGLVLLNLLEFYSLCNKLNIASDLTGPSVFSVPSPLLLIAWFRNYF